MQDAFGSFVWEAAWRNRLANRGEIMTRFLKTGCSDHPPPDVEEDPTMGTLLEEGGHKMRLSYSLSYRIRGWIKPGPI